MRGVVIDIILPIMLHKPKPGFHGHGFKLGVFFLKKWVFRLKIGKKI
jgi:hypothetical protein